MIEIRVIKEAGAYDAPHRIGYDSVGWDYFVHIKGEHIYTDRIHLKQFVYKVYGESSSRSESVDHILYDIYHYLKAGGVKEVEERFTHDYTRYLVDQVAKRQKEPQIRYVVPTIINQYPMTPEESFTRVSDKDIYYLLTS